jgi:hypothetical protein
VASFPSKCSVSPATQGCTLQEGRLQPIRIHHRGIGEGHRFLDPPRGKQGVGQRAARDGDPVVVLHLDLESERVPEVLDCLRDPVQRVVGIGQVVPADPLSPHIIGIAPNQDEFLLEFYRPLVVPGNAHADGVGIQEDRLLDNPEHATELYDHINVAEAIRLVAELRGLTPLNTRASNWMRWALPLAAAAFVILAVQLFPMSSIEEPVTFRGDSHDVMPIGPVGDQQSAPVQLVSHRVTEASAYRFELFDAEARVVHRGVPTSDLAGNLQLRRQRGRIQFEVSRLEFRSLGIAGIHDFMEGDEHT